MNETTFDSFDLKFIEASGYTPDQIDLDTLRWAMSGQYAFKAAAAGETEAAYRERNIAPRTKVVFSRGMFGAWIGTVSRVYKSRAKRYVLEEKAWRQVMMVEIRYKRADGTPSIKQERAGGVFPVGQ